MTRILVQPVRSSAPGRSGKAGFPGFTILARDLALNPALVLAVCWSCLALCHHSPLPPFPFPRDRILTVAGEISAPPQRGDGYLYLEIENVQVESSRQAPRAALREEQEAALQDDRGRIVLYLDLPEAEDAAIPGWGARICFRSYLREANYFAVPGVEDARWRLWSQGIVAVAQLKSPRQVELVSQAPWGKRWLSRYREGFRARSEKLQSDSVRILTDAGFLGDRREMPSRLREQLRDTGLVHLFSVSGFHVTLILAVAHWLCRFLGKAGRPLALSLMWLYVLMIGVPLTALRAALMSSIGYACWLQGSRKSYFNSLGLVALYLLWAWPGAAHSAGFHFSFLALLAIGVYLRLILPRVRATRKGMEELWEDSLTVERNPEAAWSRRVRFALEQTLHPWKSQWTGQRRRRVARVLVIIFHWTLFALNIQLLTLPLTIYYSNRVAWTQLPANLLLNPLFSLFLLLSLLAFALFWSPLAGMLFLALEGVGRLWILGLSRFAGLGWVSWLPHLSSQSTLLWVLLVLLLIWLSRRSSWTFPATLLFVLACWGQPPNSSPGLLQVTLVDVGQGDCLDIEYPDGSHALVDTGGLVFSDDPDYLARSVVSRYLWNGGLRSLRYLLLTHKDQDHVQGTSFLARAFSLGRLLIGPGHPKQELPRGLPLLRLQEGDRFRVAGVEHRVLNPPVSQGAVGAGNEESLVLQLSWKGFRALLTADIGARTERRMIEQGTPETLLKVPHHGSRASSSRELLSAFPSQIALVSAGRRNPFGHPSELTLQRYRERGVPIYTTKDLGTLRISSDGERWTLSHYSASEGRFEVLAKGWVGSQ